MKNNTKKHFTLSERIELESYLNQGLSFRHIAKELNKSHTTISREVQSRLVFSKTGGWGTPFNDCSFKFDCHKKNLCNYEKCSYKECHSCHLCINHCKEYQKNTCKKLSLAPFVCNSCSEKRKCTLEKRFYKAKSAQEEYQFVLKDSREGIHISPSQLQEIDDMVSPLIFNGQSVHAIYANHKNDLMLDERTLYHYINSGFLSCKTLDLPRAVKFKVRKKAPKRFKIDKKCRQGRTYEDFLAYCKNHPDLPLVQMDTVHGTRSGKVLLTLHFPVPKLMLALLLDKNNARCVTDSINHIYQSIGKTRFRKLFPIILTDNGPEFSNPSALEIDRDGKKRTKIFYCDPYASYEKGAIENNHTLLRRILPKGRSFDHLQQADINLVLSHINSYLRRDLGDHTPYDMFVNLYGDKLLKEMHICNIPPNDIILKPSLLTK